MTMIKTDGLFTKTVHDSVITNEGALGNLFGVK